MGRRKLMKGLRLECLRIDRKERAMSGNAKTAAAERYAAIQKKDRGVLQTIQTEAQIRVDKTAKLRQLRLAKEAEDAAGKLALADAKAKASTPRRKS
jgi:hypothetical protein